jgi:hypothetical protein
MWIEHKGDNNSLAGPARIGWVEVREKGKRLDYGDQRFRSLRGAGFKSNYYDMATDERYWISGCRKDGRDALYNTEAEIDEDALDEYWVNIRKWPENRNVRRISALGKNK